MGSLQGSVAWVTGAGTGIGEAVAEKLAALGAIVVVTGRRREPLEAVVKRIGAAGGQAMLRSGDLSRAATARRIVAAIERKYGRLDIVVNNAGMNVTEREWKVLDTRSVDAVIGANLSSAFYCSIAALPLMRRQHGGLLIHTASWAGRYVSRIAGPAYSAAKHAVVAMSQSLNMEEFVNGIRSTVLCPAEVSTPIMDRRPVPVSAEDRARMLQPEDLAAMVAHIATAPAHVCVNEVLISPTWNRSYLGQGARPVVVPEPTAQAAPAAAPVARSSKSASAARPARAVKRPSRAPRKS